MYEIKALPFVCCLSRDGYMRDARMQGERFHEFKKENFYQIQWRPRPASLLTSVEKKKIVKNLRKVPWAGYFRCCWQ